MTEKYIKNIEKEKTLILILGILFILISNLYSDESTTNFRIHIIHKGPGF